MSEFRRSFDLSWGQLEMPLRPTPGNHEYRVPGARDYFDYFEMQSGGWRPPPWYAFNLGYWRFIALNSNCEADRVDCGPQSEQEQWLRANLAAEPFRCTLAFWHHPRYSSGFHGSDPRTASIWRTLDQAGAELVLTGHDHHYERFELQDENGQRTDGGMREFVVGTGGSALSVVREPRVPHSVYAQNREFGVLRLRPLRRRLHLALRRAERQDDRRGHRRLLRAVSVQRATRPRAGAPAEYPCASPGRGAATDTARRLRMPGPHEAHVHLGPAAPRDRGRLRRVLGSGRRLDCAAADAGTRSIARPSSSEAARGAWRASPAHRRLIRPCPVSARDLDICSNPAVTRDVVVVGAGIVGLAVARELTRRRPELSITVLEKEDDGRPPPDLTQQRRHPRGYLLRARLAQGAPLRGGRPRALRLLRAARTSPSSGAAS